MSEALQGFTVPLTILRSAVGSYDNKGRWQPGAVETLTTVGSVQQAKPEERELLPQGSRESEVKKVYTEFVLKTSSSKDSKDADIVLYQDKRYRVDFIFDFEMGNLDHTKALIVREKDQ